MAGMMSYVPFNNEGGRSVLITETASESALLASPPWRHGDGLMRGILANLFSCGTGTAEQTPCWFLEPAEILIISRGNPPRPIPVPALAGIASRYPVRSVLLTHDVLWLLVNDPPSRPELLAGDGKHLVRWDRRSRTVQPYSLPAPARGLIQGNSQNAVVVFRDGGVKRCGDLRGLAR